MLVVLENVVTVAEVVLLHAELEKKGRRLLMKLYNRKIILTKIQHCRSSYSLTNNKDTNKILQYHY